MSNLGCTKFLTMYLKRAIGPLQLTVTRCKNRHAGTQETHWDKTNKELTSFKMVIFFVCFVPVRLLRPSMAAFVPCDCKLQRAYSALGLLMYFTTNYLSIYLYQITRAIATTRTTQLQKLHVPQLLHALQLLHQLQLQRLLHLYVLHK